MPIRQISGHALITNDEKFERMNRRPDTAIGWSVHAPRRSLLHCSIGLTTYEVPEISRNSNVRL
jgi:hypothetical protein